MAVKWGVSSPILRDTPSLHAARIAAMTGLHVQIVRPELGWDRVEALQGSPDWSKIDSAVQKLEAAGIEVLLQIDGTPQWQSGSADRFVVPGGGNGAAAATFVAWVAAYQTWVTTVVNRYKPGGTAGTNVTKWELGNEPNLGSIYWRPTADAAQYGAWYDALRSSMKAAHAAAVVGTAGFTAWTTAASGPPARTFCNTFLNGRTIDAFTCHPYTDASFSKEPELHYAGINNFDDLGLMRAKLDASGYSAVPIWITEMGFRGATAGMTPTLQATYVAKLFDLVRG